MLNAGKGARIMCADLKNHFLATLIDKPEHTKVQYECLPAGMRIKHNLDSKVTSNRWICMKIQKRHVKSKTGSNIGVLLSKELPATFWA